jgi:O-antigen ligase
VLAVALPLLVSGAALRLGEIPTVAIVGGLIALAVVLTEPFVGLLCFVAVLYVRPEETWPALKGLRLALGVSGLTLVGMTFQFMQRRLPLTRTPVLGTLGGFLVWVIVSTLPNGNTSEAAQDVLKLFLLALLVFNLVRTPERYARFVRALMFFSGYLAAYSLYLCATGQAIFDEGLVRSQATGIFGDPNDLAAAIIAGMALAVCRVARSGPRARMVYLAYIALCLVAVQQTNSRGGMMATLAVIGVATLASVKKKGPAIAIAALAGTLVFACGPARMRNFDTSEASANSRFWFWDNGVDVLLENPVLGAGYGQFPSHNGGMTAHNSFVLGFAELGFPGYTFWIGSIYFCFRRRPPEEDSEDPDARAEVLGARMALAGFLVASFWLSRTYTPVLYLLLSLPGAAQLSSSACGPPALFRRNADQQWGDWLRIAGIAFASIVLIKIIASTQK